MDLRIIIGLTLPLLGTVLGASTVFFLKDGLGLKTQKALLGFAAGVMIAASIWSLLIPSMDMAKDMGKLSFIPAVVGFLLGMAFLLLLDSIIPHLHINDDKPEGRPSAISKSFMMILAVTLHNFPEGMAVGVVLAGILEGSTAISVAGALVIAIGLAIQNIPEGAVVSTPLLTNGMSKGKSFLYGAMSGVVEPIGALLTMFFTSLITPILPYVLSFAGGAMIYVVVEELIPESQNGGHSNIGTIGLALGFATMMILDITLG